VKKAQYALPGGSRTHAWSDGAPLIRQRNPGSVCTIVVLATRLSTDSALPPDAAQDLDELMTTVTPEVVEQAAAYAGVAGARVTTPPPSRSPAARR